MRIAHGETLYDIYAEPSPIEIHMLYLSGFRYIRQCELWEGEIDYLYKINGYTQVEVLAQNYQDAPSFLNRHPFYKKHGGLIGPLIMSGVLQNDAMTLWRPEILKNTEVKGL